MQRARISADRLQSLLRYDAETGRFTWLVSPRYGINAGDEAGFVDSSNGYRKIRIDGTRYGAHQLAWLYATGRWPEHEIDHINGERADNRFANLRDVPRQINAQNQRRARRDSKYSGLLGVTFYNGRWVAQIGHCKQVIRLGRFRSKDEAHAAYVAAKRQLHEGCTL